MNWEWHNNVRGIGLQEAKKRMREELEGGGGKQEELDKKAEVGEWREVEEGKEKEENIRKENARTEKSKICLKFFSSNCGLAWFLRGVKKGIAILVWFLLGKKYVLAILLHSCLKIFWQLNSWLNVSWYVLQNLKGKHGLKLCVNPILTWVLM